jgi:prepilin-type N-terminal cleavage/methylation domain-containing protein
MFMKNLKKIVSGQKGMSLIELTVAAAISVIISMAVVKTNQTGQKGMTKITTDLDLKMWQTQRLTETLTDPDACGFTFAGQINTDQTVTTVQNSANDTEYTTGTDIEGGAWKITSMTRKAATGIVASMNKYTVRFEIAVERNNKQSFGAANKTIFIPLVVTRAGSADNTLTSCSAGGAASDSLWINNLGLNSMNSNDQFVIIGDSVTAPVAALQIEINTTNQWPPGSGIFNTLNIPMDNSAIVLGAGAEAGLYVDTTDKCLVMGHSGSGAIKKNIEACQLGTKIESTDTNVTNGGVTVGSIESTVENHSVSLGSSDSNIYSEYSLATGRGNKSFGNASFVSGSNNTVNGTYSFASGINNWSTGYGSAVFGYNSAASAMASFAAGRNAHARNTGSVAIGQNTLGYGSYAIVIGNDSWAQGQKSLALGVYAKAVHDSSTVIGGGFPVESTSTNQFTASFSNGYKFISGNSGSYPGSSAANTGNVEAKSVFIDSSGNFGIGSDLSQVTDAGSFMSNAKPKMFVHGTSEYSGDIYAHKSVYAGENITYVGSITDVSDERLKENKIPLNNSLDKVRSLSGFKYNMIDDKAKAVELGLMAQTVEKVYPELVIERNISGREGKFKTLNYIGLIAPIIESIKELYAKVIDMFTQQDSRIVELEESNAKLKSQLDEQRAMILEMKAQMKNSK